MNRKIIVGLVTCVLFASLIVACTQTKEVEVTRVVTEEVEVTRVVTEIEEVEVTRVVPEIQEVEVTRVVSEEGDAAAFMSLSALSLGIREGEIDVGDEFGLAQGQRFHNIHAEALGMKCTQCHVQDTLVGVSQPLNITDEAPGQVDRRVCLGCHLTGPADKLYEPKE